MTSKQLVPFSNGAKAMLIFRGKFRKAIVDYYEPSRDYVDFSRNKPITLAQMGDRKERVPRARTKKEHRIVIEETLGKWFRHITNMQLNDSWLADSPGMQELKQQMWKGPNLSKINITL